MPFQRGDNCKIIITYNDNFKKKFLRKNHWVYFNHTMHPSVDETPFFFQIKNIKFFEWNRENTSIILLKNQWASVKFTWHWFFFGQRYFNNYFPHLFIVRKCSHVSNAVHGLFSRKNFWNIIFYMVYRPF